MLEIDDIETGLACEKCRSEDISGSITKAGKIACSRCISTKKDPWLWETYEGIGDLEASPEVRPNPQFEGTTPKKEGVGMFESDLWEVGPEIRAMRGPWTLPPAKGGFLHTPRIESRKGSPHYVPRWQKIRIYGQAHPEKTQSEIAEDIGETRKFVSTALRGTVGLTKGTWAQSQPNLPKIEVAMSPGMRKREASKELLGSAGDQSEAWEKRQKVLEEISSTYIERMNQDDAPRQAEVIRELAKEYSIATGTVIRLLGSVYDHELAVQEKVLKGAEAKLKLKGTSREEIRDYLREFGRSSTNREIASALNVGTNTVREQRHQLGIPGHTVSKGKSGRFYRVKEEEI